MSLACHSLEDDQTKHAERLSCKSGALCHFCVQKQKSCIFFMFLLLRKITKLEIGI